MAAPPGLDAPAAPGELTLLSRRWSSADLRISPLLCLIFLLTAAPTACSAGQWPLWRYYTAAFLDAQGRVIDHARGDLTTSEGESYALFFSLVADDRADFDRVLGWTTENLAGGDLTMRLPAWKWGRAASGAWQVLDSNSAADADLWIAYTLLEAGRLWQAPRYTETGKLLAARIAREEVAALPGLGLMLLPGAEGFHLDPQRWLLNPSYVPIPVLMGLSRLAPEGPWAAVAANVPKLLASCSPGGFAMDWLRYDAASGCAPAAGPGQAAPVGSYDAIRVYLWAGMMPHAAPEAALMLEALHGMTDYLGAQLAPPEEVNAQGAVVKPAGPVGFSAAVAPLLARTGKVAALSHQVDRMTAQRDGRSGLYGRPPAYYDQNLALFSEGWSTHRFRFAPSGLLEVGWRKS